MKQLTRRDVLCSIAAGALAVPLLNDCLDAAEKSDFKFRYIVATNQFGREKIETILSVVHQLGTDTIDLWPQHWANQREQVAEMGEDAFRALLEKYKVKLGCITAFRQADFPLLEEIRMLKRFGGDSIVIGSPGLSPENDHKKSIDAFLKRHQKEMELAEELDIRLCSENHVRQVTETPDGLKRFVDAIRDYPSLGIAMAPIHLPQDETILVDLIRHCGKKLYFFYAWQKTDGPKEVPADERSRTQLPGRGKLDFKPLIDALNEIDFKGYTEIFMHTTPRDRMVHDTLERTVGELNFSREYLESLL